MKYVSVLLPLALPGTYTYTLAPELAAAVQVGSRVVVQFGARRYYTGVVTQLCDAAPQAGIALKPVVGVADASPTVLPAQLRLWQWMAQYYMCTEGEVLKAALPAGLKLESETLLVRNADFDAAGHDLTERDERLLQALDTERGKKIP